MYINIIKQYKKAYSETCGLICHSSKFSKILNLLKFIKKYNVITDQKKNYSLMGLYQTN